MTDAARIRPLRSPQDMQAAMALQQDVWSSPPIEVMPVHALLAVSSNGGQVLGAWVGESLVGLTVGMPAWRDGERFLLSHMAGVHPDFQGRGLGTALKLKQRERAAEDGYGSIRWTFDPLQRGNANFNFRLPGVRSNRYYVDYYGEMEDGINAGLPSDRLEAHWPTRDRRSRKAREFAPALPYLLRADSGGRPEAGEPSEDDDLASIEIPPDLAALKHRDPGLALEWRLGVRSAFQAAFARGCHVRGFIEHEARALYVLEAPQPWFLYVLRCNDGSLYAGISVDVDKRLRRHQAGKGAAYTAARRPLQLLACWRYRDEIAARRAEAAFKRLKRAGKLARIASSADWREGLRRQV